ncbi:MAG TPA: hypothetical protein VMK65_00815, partial [Longimicrobiales bacterium]|nr:hypothetical protein [Longimicrobiales bacterium]
MRHLPRGLLLLVLLSAPAQAQTPAENDSAAAAAKKAKALPLIPTRTLEFTAREGSWISLDLSPDGRTLVFELLGDLYTLPVEGGVAARITEGLAYDMQPRFSPDGSKLVFVSDRDGSEQVWIADADGGNARALTSGRRESYMSPVWTPDGRYVVAVKGTQLWLYHTDGGSGVQLTGHGSGNQPAHIGPAFGADPRYLWVNRRGDLGGGFELTSHEHDLSARSSAREVADFQVGVLDRETGRVHIRTHEIQGALRPVPSPDGRWLVYATRYDARPALKLLDLESGEERWLVMDVQRDDHQGGGMRDRDVYPASAFTPDSRALITSFGGRIMRVAITSGAVTEIPFEAEVRQPMGPLVKFDYPVNDTVLTASQIRGARPSPDGRRVVFSALDRLWVADLPAGDSAILRDARRLTDVGPETVEHAPVWSPDGRWIAYVTWHDSAGGDIRRVRADGGGAPERLTPSPAFYDKLAYSRDGTRLMAVRGSRMHRMRTLEDFGRHGGAAELEYVWLPASGGEPSRITWVGAGATQEGRNAPHSGPDPERVYIWTGSEGLVSVRWDGTDARTLVKVSAPANPGARPGGPPPTPDEVLLSPEGGRALVRANRNVWLITVPPVGGEPPTVAVAGGSVVPTRRLTRVGGDFVGWSEDGATAYWSIGRSFFRYEVARADSLVADSVAAARRASPSGDDAPPAPGDSAAAPDSAAAAQPADSTGGKKPRVAYEPLRADVEITLRKDRPEGVVALTGARLITMRGDEVIERGDLVVRDNRIVAVGPAGSVAIPADARVFDMAGKTILPGLVDIHAHTWVAWGVHRSQVSQFLAQLAYGVTTQRDPQTSSEDVLTYGDRM